MKPLEYFCNILDLLMRCLQNFVYGTVVAVNIPKDLDKFCQ